MRLKLRLRGESLRANIKVCAGGRGGVPGAGWLGTQTPACPLRSLRRRESCRRRGGRECGAELTRRIRTPQRQVHKADHFLGILSLENLAGGVEPGQDARCASTSLRKAWAGLSCPTQYSKASRDRFRFKPTVVTGTPSWCAFSGRPPVHCTDHPIQCVLILAYFHH